jgi:hypothetical protein
VVVQHQQHGDGAQAVESWEVCGGWRRCGRWRHGRAAQRSAPFAARPHAFATRSWPAGDLTEEELRARSVADG